MICRCGAATRLPVLPLPLGTNSCACCGAISPVYALWAICRACRDPFCPACSAEPIQEPEERGVSVTICRTCSEVIE